MKKLWILGIVALYFTATSCGSYEDCRSDNTPHPAKEVKIVNQDLS